MLNSTALTRYEIPRHEAAANPRHLPKDIDIEIPATSPLANFWFGGYKLDHRNVKQIAILAGVYLAGMVGYAFSLIYRVCALVYRVLKLMVTLIGYAAGCLSLETLKYTAWKTLRRFLEVLSAGVGVACPPAGYFLDRQIDRLADPKEQKFYNFVFEQEEEMSTSEALRVLGFDGEVGYPSPKEVKEAYRARASVEHPDKRQSGDNTEMQKLNNAKDKLAATPPPGLLTPLRFRPLRFEQMAEFG